MARGRTEGRKLRVSCSRERASSRLLSPGHVRATSGRANANTISFRGHSSIETMDFSLALVISLELELHALPELYCNAK